MPIAEPPGHLLELGTPGAVQRRPCDGERRVPCGVDDARADAAERRPRGVRESIIHVVDDYNPIPLQHGGAEPLLKLLRVRAVVDDRGRIRSKRFAATGCPFRALPGLGFATMRCNFSNQSPSISSTGLFLTRRRYFSNWARFSRRRASFRSGVSFRPFRVRMNSSNTSPKVGRCGASGVASSGLRPAARFFRIVAQNAGTGACDATSSTSR